MTSSIRSSAAPIDVRQLGSIDYLAAWQLQRELVDARIAGGPDTLLLLEHPAVYTAGRRTQPHERPVDGTPVIDTDRGGKITWHGPGQLVGYPIIGLTEPLDVVNYVRRLEGALIKVCNDLGLEVGRVDGRSGVWLPAGSGRPARKVAAIGVRVSHATTLHGFALNCDCDLAAFARIIPCGIADAGVTSLSVELGRRVGVDDVRSAVADAVRDALDGILPCSPDGTAPQPPVPAGIVACSPDGTAPQPAVPAGIVARGLDGTAPQPPVPAGIVAVHA
ncbi:lipoyl(octanoyl) transferase LipB [Mycobacterium sp. SM1]|nr:lipoyl(octanoyl) transferase LipB [Mycobacterium sp. SM1]